MVPVEVEVVGLAVAVVLEEVATLILNILKM